jgi:hypothetical protein
MKNKTKQTTTQYMLDTTMRKQTQITVSFGSDLLVKNKVPVLYPCLVNINGML